MGSTGAVTGSFGTFESSFGSVVFGELLLVFSMTVLDEALDMRSVSDDIWEKVERSEEEWKQKPVSFFDLKDFFVGSWVGTGEA